MTVTGEGGPIVAGIDAVRSWRPTAAWAADEAERRRLPLRLVHGVPPLVHDARGFEGDVYHKSLLKRGDEVLDEVAAFVRERRPGLEVATLLADGGPAQVLLRQAHHARLVVLGSRRLSRLEEVVSANSVVVPVSAQAACPVVVVVDGEHVTQQPPYVVVGVDGSDSSEAAVDHAFEAAALRGADLRALWVWQAPPLGLVDEPSAIEECRRLLSEAVAGRAGAYPDVQVSHEVVRGHPVEELAGASEHALAVVVGRRGRGGFTGMRLGSVPHGLLHHAHCPVVTVPPRDGK
ncbi:universal stress protein [Kitasatospora atroaurantiaca]|uniref:Nucleotide-binding universal stress UspA family protein n=1 Tax=Kitasatospora atroaurantiaca TaxID=285545 RepID=A0A561EJV8_9ACTN|nr:universal stress protein [Kitasatospora atroaurantiaca]TWE15896.1 nucleotide-binding universal stress UspA family protein [Kitasatospora atroaurantiaca]